MADRPSRNNRAAPIRLGFGQGGDGQRGGGGGANNGRHPPRRRRNNNNVCH